MSAATQKSKQKKKKNGLIFSGNEEEDEDENDWLIPWVSGAMKVADDTKPMNTHWISFFKEIQDFHIYQPIYLADKYILLWCVS